MKNFYTIWALLFISTFGLAQGPSANIKEDVNELHRLIDKKADEIEAKVIEWRRYIHQNPELSNREFKTAEMIAAYLKEIGIEVQTGIAKTGVKGILKGGKPGPVVALRADMDALPVKERVNLPFKSQAKGRYRGQEVDVMHACGHDTHVAMLMGAAGILSSIKAEIKGTIIFIFQPAEEGAPPGETGGAKDMVAEGILENPTVDVAFGIHINSQTEINKIRYKPQGAMAAADQFEITVNGKQSHGSQPWSGVDPIVIGAQIVMGLQTIISRQTELTKDAAVITVGIFNAGVRNNIIPEKATMIGTIRTLDAEMQDIIHEKIKKTATLIAEAGGATADVKIIRGVPVTVNNPALTRQMLPTLFDVAGEDNVFLSKAKTGAEDFSFYANKVPSLFVFLGGMPKGQSPIDAAAHHTPDFYIDDSGLKLGVRTYARLAIDYQNSSK